MAGEITPDEAFPELFSEYIDYKRNLGYVYPDSRLYLVRRLSRFLAGRAADERVLTRDSAEEFARPRDAEAGGTAAARRGIARQFALFLRWKGIHGSGRPGPGCPHGPGQQHFGLGDSLDLPVVPPARSGRCCRPYSAARWSASTCPPAHRVTRCKRKPDTASRVPTVSGTSRPPNALTSINA